MARTAQEAAMQRAKKKLKEAEAKLRELEEKENDEASDGSDSEYRPPSSGEKSTPAYSYINLT